MPAQPGDFVARKALPLLAARMKAELDAAKRRIASWNSSSVSSASRPNDNKNVAGAGNSGRHRSTVCRTPHAPQSGDIGASWIAFALRLSWNASITEPR